MGVTSGNFITSDSGQGNAQYYGRMIFEWWETGSGISGSVGYHNISYHLKSYGGQSGYWQYFYNGSMNVDGAGYSWGKTQVWGNGATVFGDYSNTLYTNSSGQRSFSASAQGGIFNNTINTSGSGSWTFNDIALYGAIDSWSSGAITDEDSLTVNWHHYTGTAQLWLRLDDIDSGDTTYRINSPGNPYTYSSIATWAQTKMVNTNSTRMFLYYGDDLDSNGSIDHYNGAWVGTITIKNDVGQANPTFADFTYKDNNGTTTAITGNDQYLIQGQSQLRVTVSTANKATPNKNATMDHYTVNIGSYSNNSAYSAVADVVHDVGVVSSVTGTQNLTVRAVDSRTNNTPITKSITILPYAAPVVNATAIRANGYDDALILTVNGTISPLTISTDKNSVHSSATATANRVEYRVSTDGAAYGAWTDLAVTQGGTGTGTITGNSTPTIAAALSASADHYFSIQVKFTDKIGSTTQTITVPVGTPIFRIGTDGFLYFKETEFHNEYGNTKVNSQTTASTLTADVSLYGEQEITALAGALTIAAPTNAIKGKRVLFAFKDNGVSRALTWNAAFVGIGVTPPTATVAGKWMYVGAVAQSSSVFHVVGVNMQA